MILFKNVNVRKELYMVHSTIIDRAQKIDLAEIDMGGSFGNTKMG